MVNKNAAMEKLLNGQRQQSAESMAEFVALIVEKTRLIGEAVVYDDEGIDETKVDFSRIFSFVNDWTGYEISCNEIQVNCSQYSADDCIILIRDIKNALEDCFQNRRFVVFVTITEQEAVIQFHTFRENAQSWLLQDIELYSEPIAVV